LLHAGVSLRARHLANLPVVEMILPVWFDLLEESFSHSEVQFKRFCPPVKKVTLLLKVLMKPLPTMFERDCGQANLYTGYCSNY